MQANTIKYFLNYKITHINTYSLRYYLEKNLTKYNLNKSIIFNVSINHIIKNLFYLNIKIKSLINRFKYILLHNKHQIKPP